MINKKNAAKVQAMREKLAPVLWKGLALLADSDRAGDQNGFTLDDLIQHHAIRQLIEDLGIQADSMYYRPEFSADQALQEVLWDWANQGIIRVRMYNPSGDPRQNRYYMTSYGYQCLASGEFENTPYDPDGYVRELEVGTGGLSPLIRTYLGEALTCFNRQGSYLAAMVMLGAASEAALLALCDEATPGYKPRENATTLYKNMLERLVKRESADKSFKESLKAAMRDDWRQQLDYGFQIIRVSRNEAGHPHLMSSVSRIQTRDRFIVFSTYITAVYQLIGFLKNNP